jgi:hypothetical protein
MAANKGFKVPMTVVTQDDRDKYPVVNTNDVAGGLHSVDTIGDMLSIPYLRRRLGMRCYVTSLEKEYKLISHTDADITIIANWEEVKKGVMPEELDSYTKKSEFDTVKNTVDSLPDLTKMATHGDLQALQNQIPNMDEYVKKSDISIPDSGSGESGGGESGGGGTMVLPDFTKFATKDEVQQVQVQIPDMSQYVKKSEISIPGTSGGTPTLPDFTQFATKSDVQSVDNKTVTNKNNLANHIIYTQDELDKLQWQQKEFTVEQSEVPKEVTIDIKNANSAYKYPPVEVLKHTQLTTSIEETVTLADFTASEASRYETNDKVTFDGSLHITPDVSINMSEPTLFTSGVYVSISDPISYDRIQNAASITIE